MKVKSRTKKIFVVAALAAVMLIAAGRAEAARWADTPSGKDLVITAATVSFDSKEIIVTGKNFDSGYSPIATLGDKSLTVISYTATELHAVLPDVSAGDYLLTIATGSAVSQYDAYALTIGAVGPQGPQGPQGVPGPLPDMSAYYTKAQVDGFLNSILVPLSAQVTTLQSSVTTLQSQLTTLTARVDALGSGGGGPSPSPQVNTIVVALDGSGNYTSPLQAMASITDASSTKPYTIKIMPGVYDIGSSALQMKSYVTVEGSGQQSTKIMGTDFYSGCVISGASNAELKSLSITKVGGKALCNHNASPRITDVSVSVSKSGYGIYNDMGSAPTITGVAVTVTTEGSPSMALYSYGIWNQDALPTITDTTVQSYSTGTTEVTGSYGIKSYDSQLNMKNVTVTASGGLYSIAIDSQRSAITMVDVTASANGGGSEGRGQAINNDGCISANMEQVVAIATAAYDTTGIRNVGCSSVVMTNVRALGADGSNTNIGVLNSGDSNVIMTSVSASAYGRGAGTINTGILFVSSASAVLTDVTALASDYFSNVGIDAYASIVDISNSSISTCYPTPSRSCASLLAHNGSLFTVKNTILIGPASPANYLTCTGVYDGNNNPLDSHCQ